MSATNTLPSIKSIFTDFKEITKAGLAISVVFSSLAGYLLGIHAFNMNTIYVLIMLAIGGYCMVGASNAYNQIIEKDLDALMDRTKKSSYSIGKNVSKYCFYNCNNFNNHRFSNFVYDKS